MYRYGIFLLLILLRLSRCTFIDQCRGNVLNANNNKRAGIEMHIHPWTNTKTITTQCVQCVDNVYKSGSKFCLAPTIAVDSTCKCHIQDKNNCKCFDQLSLVGMIIICVITPVLVFFGLMICIFSCLQKPSSKPQQRQRNRFNQTGIYDARNVGLSPAANYIPQQRRPPPPPPLSQGNNNNNLTRTPHYVSRSRQQRL